MEPTSIHGPKGDAGRPPYARVFREPRPRPFRGPSRKSLQFRNREVCSELQGAVLPAISFLARRMQSSSLPRRGGESTLSRIVAIGEGQPMRDWMAFATAVVVALLTRMLLA